MPVSKIARKRVVLFIPLAAYHSLEKLTVDTERTVPGYIRHLIAEELMRCNLPLYQSRKN